MNFGRKMLLLALSQCLLMACDRDKMIVSYENVLQSSWNRKDVIKNVIPIDEDYSDVGLALDIYYGDEVQFQNIFLHVILKDQDGGVVFEKKDLMLTLFRPTTGEPLGRRIFREQHLKFLIVDDLDIKKGEYSVEVSQMTRAENLYGIKKIITSFQKL